MCLFGKWDFVKREQNDSQKLCSYIRMFHVNHDALAKEINILGKKN